MGSGNKIVHILKALAKNPYEYGVTELSDIIGCGKSGTHKHLGILVEEGLVTQLKNKKYCLGLSAYLIGKAYEDHIGIAKFCRPHLERLRDKTEENASFGMWIDDEVTMLYKIESRQAVRVVGGIGGTRPINATAIGKTLAAYIRPDTLMSIIEKRPLERFTKNTIVDIDAFFKELALIRERGYAISDEEFSEGTIGIGVPVFNSQEKVWAAISLGAPKIRMTEDKLASAIEMVKATAEDISQEYCHGL